MAKRSLLLSLALAAITISSPGLAYDLPKSDPSKSYGPEVKVLQELSHGVAKLSAQASQAVVFVSVSKIVKGMPYEMNPFDFFFGPQGRMPGEMPERKQQGLGSGFFVDLDKGYIITNNHVVDEADEISLKLANGRTYNGKILGRDKHTDVAVVQVKEKNFDRKNLSALRLADSDKVEVGEFVIALGAPFGLEASVSTGVISASKRGNLDIADLGNFLQTDAAINPGNSGGPLINVEGEVIGMNTAIFSRSGTSAGIGFAIPSNIIRTIAGDLITTGKVPRGFLGVSLQELTDEIASGLGFPDTISGGALVALVQPGAPAAKAGLEAGDLVVSVDGRPVANRSDLMNQIGLLNPGAKVKLGFYRKDKLKEAIVTLGNYPEKEEVASQGDTSSGMVFQAITPQNAKSLEMQYQFRFSSKEGLLVVDVDENSRAAAAGIRPGDVILQVNREKVTKAKDFERIYKKSSSKVLIRLEREGNLLFAAIRK